MDNRFAIDNLKDINSPNEAKQYYINRSIYLLNQGYSLDFLSYPTGMVEADFLYCTSSSNLRYRSAYILDDYKNKGLYSKWVKNSPKPILVLKDCQKTHSWLERKFSEENCPSWSYIVAQSNIDIYGLPYKLIEDYYGSRRARRSNLLYMNHIDEGLYILNKRSSSSIEAKQAFCLHPLYQNDEDLKKNYSSKDINSTAIIYAMEYRRVANLYLPKDGKRKAKNIELSPLPEVNQMLIADKVQNRKDFECYLRGKVKNENILDYYFKSWLEALEVSDHIYNDIALDIQAKTGRLNEKPTKKVQSTFRFW